MADAWRRKTCSHAWGRWRCDSRYVGRVLREARASWHGRCLAHTPRRTHRLRAGRGPRRRDRAGLERSASDGVRGGTRAIATLAAGGIASVGLFDHDRVASHVLPYAADDRRSGSGWRREAERAVGARRARCAHRGAAAPGRLPLLAARGATGTRRARWPSAICASDRRLSPAQRPCSRARARTGAGATRRWPGALVRERPPGTARRPSRAAPGYFAPLLALQRLAADARARRGRPRRRRAAWLEAHDRWLAWSGAVRGRPRGSSPGPAYHRAAGDPPRRASTPSAALAHATEPRQPLALLAAHRLLGELGDRRRASTPTRGRTSTPRWRWPTPAPPPTSAP